MDISREGSLLLMKTGPATFRYTAKDVTFHFDGKVVEIKRDKIKLFTISNHKTVTSPISTSLSDLCAKLEELKK